VESLPTYRFDGFDLEYKETLYPEVANCWAFVFEFKSRHAGYGDRTGKVLAEVITHHKALVYVKNGEVTSAVLDGKWDMINQRFLDESTNESNGSVDGKVNGTIDEKQEFCGWSTYGNCSSDSDCIASGCSGQVCQSIYEEPVVTTCEWRDCYNAEKYGLRCRCIEGKCQCSE